LTDAKLTKIAVVAVALLAFTVYLYTRTTTTTRTAQSGELLVQGLDPAVITKIALQQGEKKVTLTQTGDRFLVAEKNNYPADVKDINNLLVDILDIRIANQPKSAKDVECGLDPQKPEGGTINLFGKDGKELLSLRVGKSTEKGTFLARGDAIYLSEKPLNFSVDAMNYIDQAVFSIPEKEIVRIDINNGGKTFAFAKDKQNVLQLADLPAGKEESTDQSWGVKEGLGRISMENVVQANGVEFKPEFTAEIALETTMKYQIAIAKTKDDKYLAQVRAVPPLDKKLQESMQLRTSTGKKELAEKDAVLTANDTAKAFNEKTAGWLYQLSDWNAKRLLTPYEKLLKDAPKPEVKPADKAATTSAEKPAENVAQPAEQPSK
jgi:hypothetical protein